MSEKIVELLSCLDILLSAVGAVFFFNDMSAAGSLFLLSVFRGSFSKIFFKNIKIINDK
ncbi:hypothetical protein [Epilithonimonas vandammei]|uniref:hypothetical protein n=1 Tax=Epilithonimonas vandammei TaxID=2487072 RepID=UPI00289A93CB|nr:hypothetical protein [Epilithonimonas vandammei]